MSQHRCPTCGSAAGDPAPPGRLPTAVDRGIAAKAVQVVSWHNKPQPKGRADCVALLLEVPGAPGPLVVRLLSAATVDQLAEALEWHRGDVWPEAPARSRGT